MNEQSGWAERPEEGAGISHEIREAINVAVADTVKTEIQKGLAEFFRELNIPSRVTQSMENRAPEVHHAPAANPPNSGPLYSQPPPPIHDRPPQLNHYARPFVPVGNPGLGLGMGGSQPGTSFWGGPIPNPGGPPPTWFSPVSFSNGVSRPAIRVDKWGIVFDGKSESLTVEDFIGRVEMLQASHNCSWTEVLRDFHLFLAQDAKQWYWQYQMENSTRRPDWPMLREALKRQFRNPKTDWDIMREIGARQQGFRESSDDFFAAISKLRYQLRTPVNETDLVRVVKGNLNERVRNLVYPQAIYSMDHLRIACKEVEYVFYKEDRESKRFPKPPVRFANELDAEVTHGEYLEAFHQQGLRPKQNRGYGDAKSWVCWNCKVRGHSFVDCPSSVRNVFCYRCGQEGVITPKCPVCNPENSSRNARNQGDTRSADTPPATSNPQ